MRKIIISILIVVIVFSCVPTMPAFASPFASISVSGKNCLTVGFYDIYSITIHISDMAFAYISAGGLGICLSGSRNAEWNSSTSGNSSGYVDIFVTASAIEVGTGQIFVTFAGSYYDDNGDLRDYDKSKSYYVTVEALSTPAPATASPTPSPSPEQVTASPATHGKANCKSHRYTKSRKS